VIFIINDGGILSLKMSFVIQAYKLDSNQNFFYVFRKADSRYREKWLNNQVDLATSTSGNFMHFLLMVVKSPKNIRDGLLRRLFLSKNSNVLLVEGFLSSLSQALSEYFEKPARTIAFMTFLSKLNSPKIFLIDEYASISIVNLKMLKLFGSIVYVSQDVAYNHFNFENNLIAKTLMYRLERDAVALSDVVVACSERDRLKYLEMGARKVLSYPNIYPITEFEPGCKDPEPCISIVLRGHWGARAGSSLKEIFKALSYVNRKINVYLIGMKPVHVPRNVNLHYYECIPSKLDYLKILSKSWIGINIGIHMAGSNERKYDYAMAGIAVFSDSFGVRGDLLPYEYTYVDCYDLAAKLEQLIQFGKEKIEEMGIQNRKQALTLAKEQREKLSTTLRSMVFPKH
jgi:hypothetical protein